MGPRECGGETEQPCDRDREMEQPHMSPRRWVVLNHRGGASRDLQEAVPWVSATSAAAIDLVPAARPAQTVTPGRAHA